MAEKWKDLHTMYANLSNLERFAYTESILERFANIELNFEIFRNKYFYQPKDLIFYLSKTKIDKVCQTNKYSLVLKIRTQREKTKDWNTFLGFLAQGA